MLGIIVFFTNNKMLSGSKIRQKLAARNNFATVQIVNLPVSQESFLPGASCFMVTFCLQAPRLTLANVIIEIRMNFLIFPSETICFHIFIDKTLIMIKHQRMNVNDYHYQQKECTSE